MKITFTIPDAKVQRIIDTMKGLYPIPMIPDPNFVSDPTHPEIEAPLVPQFTGNQWAKECVRRWIRDQVARWEQMQAKDKIKFAPEDDIIT